LDLQKLFGALGMGQGLNQVLRPWGNAGPAAMRF